MRIIAILVASVVIATSAAAQSIQRSSNPQGIQIQGNTEIKAEQESAGAVAVGRSNTAKNTAGAIKEDTQIQGNTEINAKQKNATSVAVGKNNKARNEAGVVGGE